MNYICNADRQTFNERIRERTEQMSQEQTVTPEKVRFVEHLGDNNCSLCCFIGYATECGAAKCMPHERSDCKRGYFVRDTPQQPETVQGCHKDAPEGLTPCVRLRVSGRTRHKRRKGAKNDCASS